MIMTRLLMILSHLFTDKTPFNDNDTPSNDIDTPIY
jgi:hypothetical protein